MNIKELVIDQPLDNVLFVGDLHSRFQSLEQMRPFIYQHDTIIFLGDLFDARSPNCNAAHTYSFIKELSQDRTVHVVHSNHQENLLRWNQGHRLNAGNGNLQETIKDLEEERLLPEVIAWLEENPWRIRFYSKKTAKIYLVAHAYHGHKRHRDFSADRIKSLCLYGVLSNNKRYRWWFDSRYYQNNSVFVSGHYHHVFLNDSAIVLDPPSGVGFYSLLTQSLIVVPEECWSITPPLIPLIPGL